MILEFRINNRFKKYGKKKRQSREVCIKVIKISYRRVSSLGTSQLKDEEQKNLWESILNDVAQRDETTESTLLILGDKGAGKRSLVSAWNKYWVKSENQLIKVDRMFSPYAGLDSAFLYVKDLSEKDAINMNVTSKENLPKLNIWSLLLVTQAPYIEFR